MKEKIYKYLLSHPEGVTSQELLEEFFRIYSEAPLGREKILQNLLHGDNRFKQNDDGRWFASEQELKEEDLSQILFAVIDFWEIDQARKIKLPVVMGLVFMKSEKIEAKRLLKINHESISGVRLSLSNSMKQNLAGVQGDFESFAWEILSKLQKSIVISRSPGRHYRLLKSLLARTIGAEYEFEFLSLKDLSRQFMGEQISQLIEQRLSVQFKNRIDAFFEKLKVQSEILAEILLECREQNIVTITELKEALSQSEIWVDFKNYNFNREFLINLPDKPGVYFFIDENDKIFYVGKSRNLKARIRSYFINRFRPVEKNKKIAERIKKIEYELAGSELEALLLENRYIRQFRPELNVQVKIHGNESSKKKRKRLAIFLPDAMFIEVRMVLLDGSKRAIIIPVNRHNEDEIASAQDKLAVFFSGEDISNSESDRQQIQLIWRWYDLNKDKLTVLDVDDYSDLLQCAKMIPQIINDKSIFNQTIIFREPMS